MSTSTLLITIGLTIAMIVGPILVLYLLIKQGLNIARSHTNVVDEDGHPVTATAIADKYDLERSWRGSGYRLHGARNGLAIEFQTWEVSSRRRSFFFPDSNEGSELTVEFHIPLPPGLALGLWDEEITDGLRVLDVGMRRVDRGHKGRIVYTADDLDEAAEFLDHEHIHKWLGFMAGLGDALDFRNHTFRWEAKGDVDIQTVDWIFYQLWRAREAMRDQFEAMSAPEEPELPGGDWQAG